MHQTPTRPARKKPSNPVIDIPRRRLPKLTEVIVTDADIRNGKQGNGEFCPIACALRRTLKDAGVPDTVDISVTSRFPEIILPSDEVNVDIRVNGKFQDSMSIFLDEETIELDLGKQAGTFIDRFDQRGASAVRPTVFNVKKRR